MLLTIVYEDAYGPGEVVRKHKAEDMKHVKWFLSIKPGMHIKYRIKKWSVIPQKGPSGHVTNHPEPRSAKPLPVVKQQWGLDFQKAYVQFRDVIPFSVFCMM